MLDVGLVVGWGREAAEGLMTDACTITHPATTSTFDPETLTNVPVAGSSVYVGACRIQSPPQGAAPGQPDAGDHRFVTQGYLISIPVGAPSPAVHDRVEITASAFDSANVGRKFVVVGLLRKSHATAQRLQCEELVG